MTRFRMAFVPTLLALLAAAVAHAGEAKAIPIGGATLHIAVPEGWSSSIDNQTPPTITLKAADPSKANLLLTAVGPQTTDAALRKSALTTGNFYAPGSVEKKVTLTEVKGKAIHGFMSSFTDASKGTVEFRYVTAGNLVSGKREFIATLLTQSKDAPERAAGLEAIRSISVVAEGPDGAPAGAPAGGAASKSASRDELRIPSPDGSWVLVLPGKWRSRGVQVSPDGKSAQVAAMSAGGMMMTIFLEPAANPDGNAEAARAFYLERMKENPLGMDGLKQQLVGEVATLEYDQGLGDFTQHNLNAYLAHKGIWVDVHVSKPGFNERTDRATIDALVKGMRAEDRTQKSLDGGSGSKSQGTKQQGTATKGTTQQGTKQGTKPQNPKQGSAPSAPQG